MKIQSSRLKQISKNLLSILDKQGINYLPDVEKKLGSRIPIEDGSDCKLSIESRPSNAETTAYTLSYICPEIGIPIEVRINPELDYNMLIIKTQQNIKGYHHFNTDVFQNKMQCTTIRPAEVDLAKELLAELPKLIDLS